MMKRAEDKPVERIVKAKIDKPKVTCRNCNYVNRTASKFCVKCGSPVKGKDKPKVTCRNCNYVNRTASKFCVKCGSPVKGKVT